MTEIINREAASTSGKGLLFQKYRAVFRLLDSISKTSEQIYCATEFIEDSLVIHEEANSAYSLEENKHYSSSLSFNSSAIKNTLVAFCDQYFHLLEDSQSLNFSMYCSAKLADESIDNKLIISLDPNYLPTSQCKSSFSILKKLSSDLELSETEILIARALFEEEYVKQYTFIDGDGSKVTGGKSTKVKAWSNDEFYNFIKSINFDFEVTSISGYEDLVLEKIRESRFFSYKHDGLESFILSGLVNLFDKRQMNEHKLSRFVNTSDVELVFTKIATSQNELKPIDPTFEMFSEIEMESSRNLEDKYCSVLDCVPPKYISRLNRRASSSRKNEDLFGKGYAALRFRIYDCCEEYMDSKIEKRKHSRDELDAHLDSMTELCITKLNSLKCTYDIKMIDRDNIQGVILSLIDDCYLAYD